MISTNTEKWMLQKWGNFPCLMLVIVWYFCKQFKWTPVMFLVCWATHFIHFSMSSRCTWASHRLELMARFAFHFTNEIIRMGFVARDKDFFIFFSQNTVPLPTVLTLVALGEIEILYRWSYLENPVQDFFVSVCKDFQ